MKYFLSIVILLLALTGVAQQRFSITTDWENGYDWNLQVINTGTQYIAYSKSGGIGYGFHAFINEYGYDGTFINTYKIDRPLGYEHGGGGKLLVKSNGLFVISQIMDSLTGVSSETGYLMSIANNYDTIWSNRYYDAMDFQTTFIDGVEVSNNYYLIYGVVKTDTANWETSQLYLMAVDSNGTQLWEQTYGYPMKEIAKKIIPTHDGNYLLLGWSDRNMASTPTGITREAYLVQVDSLGNKLWERIIKHSKIEDGETLAEDIIIDDNGNYILCGWENAELVPPYDFSAFVLKTDQRGNQIWQRHIDTIPDGMRTYLKSIQELPDGTMIATGHRYISPTSNLQGWAIKVSPIGTILWERTYDHYQIDDDNYLSDMLLTSDGGFVACGMTDSSLKPQDGWLIKADCNGCIDSSCVAIYDTCLVYNCLTDSLPQAVFQLSEDTIDWVAGDTVHIYTMNNSQYAAHYTWLMDGSQYSNLVYDSLVFTTPGEYAFTLVSSNQNCHDTLIQTLWIKDVTGMEEKMSMESGVEVFPNPFNETLTVRLSKMNRHAIHEPSWQDTKQSFARKINIYNLLGEIVIQQQIPRSSLTLNDVAVDVSNLESGIYIVEVEGVGRVEVVKE